MWLLSRTIIFSIIPMTILGDRILLDLGVKDPLVWPTPPVCNDIVQSVYGSYVFSKLPRHPLKYFLSHKDDRDTRHNGKKLRAPVHTQHTEPRQPPAVRELPAPAAADTHSSYLREPGAAPIEPLLKLLPILFHSLTWIIFIHAQSYRKPKLLFPGAPKDLQSCQLFHRIVNCLFSLWGRRFSYLFGLKKGSRSMIPYYDSRHITAYCISYHFLW